MGKQMFIDGVHQCCIKLLALNVAITQVEPVAITQVEPVMHGEDTVPFLLTLKEDFIW